MTEDVFIRTIRNRFFLKNIRCVVQLQRPQNWKLPEGYSLDMDTAQNHYSESRWHYASKQLALAFEFAESLVEIAFSSFKRRDQMAFCSFVKFVLPLGTQQLSDLQCPKENSDFVGPYADIRVTRLQPTLMAEAPGYQNSWLPSNVV